MEQVAVNHKVGGSNPLSGARERLRKAVFFYFDCLVVACEACVCREVNNSHLWLNACETTLVGLNREHEFLGLESEMIAKNCTNINIDNLGRLC